MQKKNIYISLKGVSYIFVALPAITITNINTINIII